MAEIGLTIEVISPIHIGSGRADVNIDAEIVHDAVGLPYFPARRFKGLLYESAVEVSEMLALSKIEFDAAIVEEIFHHQSASPVQLIVPNFRLQSPERYRKIRAEWEYLQQKYAEFFRPIDLLETFTSVRYQTRLKNGVADDGSLHNMRVLDSGVKFKGKLELKNGGEEHLQLLVPAVGNVSSAGLKRNRGFGKIRCSMSEGDVLIEKFFRARGL